jgi:uncharacterized protein (TIGR00255 family)
MIHSMTGFAAATRELTHGTLALELRSVNHRYLELQFRLPEELRALEPALREAVAARIARGKIECRVSFAPAAAAPRALQLDTALLRELLALAARVRAAAPDAAALSVAEILRWPGVLGQEAPPLEDLKAACRELLERALGELDAVRAREGGQLAQAILERAAAIERLIGEIAPRIPRAAAAYQERLAARLKEALGSGEEERIRQEVALFAGRIDVDEELSRLAAHVAEVKRVLGAGGVCGKRLDFLMQELNREANTLASKSVDLAVTQAALDLKLLVEQMREQIQNIE